jgi:hypothetical protein
VLLAASLSADEAATVLGITVLGVTSSLSSISCRAGLLLLLLPLLLLLLLLLLQP